ncbi:MAG: CSS-motif domain-containing protein, partial [Pseudomonas sp.]
MSKFTHAGRSLLELLLLLAMGMVPVCTGLMVMFFQLEKKLAENSSVSVKEAVFSVDQALDRLHEAALLALPLASKPCSAVMSTLQKQVARSSMIKSLSLVEGKQAYCSSTPDSMPQLTAFAISGNRVELVHASSAAPNELLINYYLPSDEQGVILTAYATQLRNELNAFQDGLTLLLEFDDRYLWSHGDSRDEQRPSQSEFPESALSVKYGYQVKGGYAQGYTA